MTTQTKPLILQRNRLFVALSACGLVAASSVTPMAAVAAGPLARAVAYEWRAPMDRPGSGGLGSIEADGVTPRSFGVKAGGPGGLPSAMTPFTVAPLNLDFDVVIGQTSLPQRSTITNMTGYSCSISLLPNGFGGGFAYTSNCGTLADGSSCNIDVTYRPFDFFDDSGNITVASGCGSGFINLYGKALSSPRPLIQVSPTSLDFPPTAVGDFSEVKYLTIRNDSPAIMDIGGSGVGDFIVLPPDTGMAMLRDPGVPLAKGRKAQPPAFAGNCYGFISPGAACELAVVFAPTGTGVRDGLVAISASSASNTFSVSTRGIGRDGSVLSTLTVTEEIDFGPQPVGATSGPREFGIRNNTSAPVIISELTVTGDFEVQKGTCDTIAPTATCSANLLFKPTALGPRSGAVTVKTPSDSSPYVTSLKGSGTANVNPMLTLSARQLGFSQGIVGSGDSLSITATNTGSVPVSIARIYALGDYMPTHTCPAILGPGLTCTIEVGFVPRLVGLRTGSLIVESNAIQSPNTAELRGIGCTFFAASARGRTLLCSPS